MSKTGKTLAEMRAESLIADSDDFKDKMRRISHREFEKEYLGFDTREPRFEMPPKPKCPNCSLRGLTFWKKDGLEYLKCKFCGHKVGAPNCDYF